MLREKNISKDAMAVLSECTQEGQIIRITSGQLARPLYEEVNAVLTAIGGKWNRGKKGHVFTEPANEVADMLEGCIQTGRAIPLRPAGYFETPCAVVSRMVELAQLEMNMHVLEPSAGRGAIVEVLLGIGSIYVDAVELDKKLVRELLQRFQVFVGSRLAVYDEDFFDFSKAVPASYDRVLMNPPFIRLSEIEHIKHAWDCVKPGGRLVSVASAGVTFRREPTALHFRKFIAEYGRIEALPSGSFKESGTMVNCVLVILDKPIA